MKAFKKERPEPHFVIVDTNILFSKDKRAVCNVEFASFWMQQKDSFPLELGIPEIVRDELIYRQFLEAKKNFDEAVQGHANVRAITGLNYKIRLTSERIRIGLSKKLAKWIKYYDAKLIPVPIAKIDWSLLIERSVWRQPPFSSEPNKEKGFRDNLIYETIAHLVTTEKSRRVVFLSSDEHLVACLNAKLSAERNFSCFQSLDAFSSYLKFSIENIDNQFKSRLFIKATQKFFTLNDFESLYYKAQIQQKIQSEHAPLFENPEISSSQVLGRQPLTITWEPLNAGTWFISEAEYISSEDKIYKWRTKIFFVREHRNRNFASLGFQTGNHVALLKFYVYWQAYVKDDSRFYNMALVHIEVISSEFRQPTSTEIEVFKLSELGPSNTDASSENLSQ